MPDARLPIDLPEQRGPERLIESAVRCRFCRRDVGRDPGLRAWRMCDECFESAEWPE